MSRHQHRQDKLSDRQALFLYFFAVIDGLLIAFLVSRALPVIELQSPLVGFAAIALLCLGYFVTIQYKSLVSNIISFALTFPSFGILVGYVFYAAGWDSVYRVVAIAVIVFSLIAVSGIIYPKLLLTPTVYILAIPCFFIAFVLSAQITTFISMTQGTFSIFDAISTFVFGIAVISSLQKALRYDDIHEVLDGASLLSWEILLLFFRKRHHIGAKPIRQVQKLYATVQVQKKPLQVLNSPITELAGDVPFDQSHSTRQTVLSLLKAGWRIQSGKATNLGDSYLLHITLEREVL